MDNYFQTLNAINVNGKTEKKNGLTYLAWAWAWGEVKKLFPEANYTIYERETEYGPVNYFTDGRTCWVKTGVTINGIEHVEDLPVMDFKNNSIPLEKVTSYDVNKAIQRSLTKACARHGLGLYIYAGEDLPEGETIEEVVEKFNKEPPKLVCEDCSRVIIGYNGANGKPVDVMKHIEATRKRYGKALCIDCVMKKKAEESDDRAAG